ncbi:hypothetical protein [Natrialba sp. INN-245]|uniref:hypothetical protein n=1 Tax=Natrialba sp. INN-245 TaxID=2690967 RepID=UPI001310C014|nr:hypothetical protein [Natrialba sp. INN-245]MWV40879.1 hypothetical protein [Natrialba sp. INN-245]
MFGVASSTAAADETGSQREDEELTIAEGTSGYVTSDKETPDWFSLKSGGDAKWNIGDFNKKENQGLVPHAQLDCDGDQLDWGGTVEKWGVVFTLHLDHCAGSCNWKFEIEALGQSGTTGLAEDCDGSESISGGVHPLRFNVEVHAHEPWPPTEFVEYWDVEMHVEYYDPSSGWEDATWEFRINNPAA